MKTSKKIILFFGFFFLLGLAWPQGKIIPVKNADVNSWNPRSFWAFPWGKSVVHKGIDIFAPEGTDVVAATSGLLLYRGEIKMGGKVVLILGPKWRVHYYAHLKDIAPLRFPFIKRGKKIGEVGVTGNAKGKPPHLHYTVATFLPHFWLIDSQPLGWLKMFYLDPAAGFGS